MKILAIDSSGLTASVAVVEDGVLRAEYTVNYKKTHSQTLLPMLDEIRKMTELDLSTVDYLAVAAGPGSFTGLRIGSATVKGLGLALGRPVVEVPTLEGLAYNLWGTDRVVCPLMDARRNQVYTGIYRFAQEDGVYRLNCLREQTTADITEIVQSCNALGEPVVFLGDGVPVYRKQIEDLIRVPYALAPAHRAQQSAASVAALGYLYALEGRVVPAAEHRPEYLRKSQAEREREEKKKEEMHSDDRA